MTVINIAIDKKEALNYRIKARYESDRYIRCYKIDCPNENIMSTECLDCKKCIFNTTEEIRKTDLIKQGRIVEERTLCIK